jgi:hypothetical protein
MYGATPKAIIEPYFKGNIGNQERMEQLQYWRNDALLAHEYARQRMKEKIKSTFTPFKKGDRVWLEGTNLKSGYNKKITTKREGPFTITEVLGPITYRLKLPDKWRIKDTFHASPSYAIHGDQGPWTKLPSTTTRYHRRRTRMGN